MYRRILIGGVTAAFIVGAGGTALALTGSDTTSGTPATAVGAGQAVAGRAATGQQALAGRLHTHLLKRLAHAQVVTKGPHGFVTHDLINGTVTAVSATSISVRAADGTSETFVVDTFTKVRVRTAGHGAAGAINDVAKGDQAFVAGTGTSTLTAKHIIVIKK